MALCSIDGCSRKKKYSKKGWCQTHYHRWWRHGDPQFIKKERVAVPSYRGLHTRITRKRGKASEQLCHGCSAQAKHWAYDGTDSNPLWATFGERTIPYSLDDYRYIPLCRGCHVKLDRYDLTYT